VRLRHSHIVPVVGFGFPPEGVMTEVSQRYTRRHVLAIQAGRGPASTSTSA
jgi:hypothetical protein